MSGDFLLKLLIIFFCAFLVTFIFIPFLMKKFKEIGIIGVDVHKLDKPKIPEMGGVGIICGITVAVFVALYFFKEYYLELIVFLSCFLIAGFIGAVDDLKKLGAVHKTILTTIACFPLIITGTFTPRPYFPIIGRTRLTIVYWILLPFSIAVPANTVNMLDIFNGIMPATCILVLIAVLIVSLILGSEIGIILSILMLGSLVAFLYFNKYPAKIFSGDIGSLSVGAGIGAIAVMGRLEIVMIIAMIPHIMNSFYILSSLGRLKERDQITRPTKLLPDGKLADNIHPQAPLTLAKLILAERPMTEKEIIRVILSLTLFSILLAIFTGILIPKR